MTETLSIKVPLQAKARLRAAAKRRHSTPSALLREALELVLAGKSANGKVSLYELSRDLFEEKKSGGPRDLSTNPRYLRNFGK
jgi:predicted DNA-binding protein